MDIGALVRGMSSAFQHPLRISEPCYGMGGVREMMSLGAVPHQAVNVFEIDGAMKHYHSLLHEALGDDCMNPEAASWGADSGNLLDVPLDALEPCDGLVSGPPCTPWAHNGKRLGKADPRSQVFERVVEWIMHLALTGGLWFFLLENSTNIAAKVHDEKIPYIEEVKARLEARMPDWVIDLSFSSLESFIPHKRSRCWLRGLRRDMLPGSVQSIPAPLACIGVGPVPLEHLLEAGLEVFPPEAMTTTKKMENTTLYLSEIEAMVRANPNHQHRIAVFDPCRAQGKKWKVRVHYDVVPALRTSGPWYFVVSLWDWDSAVQDKAIFRFLTLGERFLLSGHRSEYSKFSSKRLAARMTGNAYAVPMLTAAMAPVLTTAGQSLHQGSDAEGHSIKRLRMLL